MAREIVVPRLGWSMEEGVFGEWLVKHGETVRPGDAIFVIESDKTATDVEAMDGGILHILPPGPEPGDTVTVGQLLGHLCDVGEKPPRKRTAPGRPADRAEPAEKEKGRGGARGNGRPRVRSPAEGCRAAVPPRAARVDAELGGEVSAGREAGRTGGVREPDIRRAAGESSRPGQPSAPGASAGRSASHAAVRESKRPVSTIRRTIAQRMSAGVHETAHVTLTSKLDATQLVAVRDHFKQTAARPEAAPGITAILIKLAGMTLAEHPLLNARWEGDAIVFPGRIDVAVAVETEAGLLAPVVRNVPELALADVEHRLRELTRGAREGRLPPEDLTGGTFTLSNLGMYAVDAFTPILNMPQSAILGAGRIRREPAVIGDQVVPRDMVTFSLTFDHRVIDGGPAARFLGSLRAWIEQPLAVALGP